LILIVLNWQYVQNTETQMSILFFPVMCKVKRGISLYPFSFLLQKW